EMQKQREKFVKGCAEKNKIPASKANQIFDLLEKFAGYGFNKSHAAAYAIVAYQTAYLKANFPVEFFCAMMTNDMADTEKLSKYIDEAREFGIEVLQPDVNESGVYFEPARRDGRDGDAKIGIRFGLAAVKNVGEATVQSVLKERDENGKFKSLADLCERVETRALNRKVLEALIKCGACDCFRQTRATMFFQIDRALGRAASIQSDRQRGQSSLFGTFEEKPESGFGSGDVEKSLPEWPQHELLAYEKELLGFYVTGHPLTPYVPLLKKYALANTSQLAELPNREMTRIGGLIAAVQNGVSKKSGKPYSMVTLEDLEGTVQVLCMNENYEKFKPLLQPNKAVLVTGEVNSGDERPKIFPQEIIALDDAPKKFTKQVHLRLQTAHLQPAQLESVRDMVAGHPGKCPLFLCFMQPAGEVFFMQANDRFAVTPSLELQHLADTRFGEGTYYAKVDTTLPERQSRWPRKGATNGDD
ncbi:MAG TPA: OB-fold nucleic acid binding domain-containing protein, partial [Verrucomicrobiae bacterium]|nr:OB-fold nucleic acid binding domain-containing protein [Verrucomicrobiae bacterium]